MMNKAAIRRFLNIFYPIVALGLFLLLFPVWKLMFFLKKHPDSISQSKEIFPIPLHVVLVVLFLLYVTILVVIFVMELILRTRKDYLMVKSATGDILLKENSVAQFIRDTLLEINGVDLVDIEVTILKENAIGLNIWVDSTEKNDYVRFSERIQQRVIQDLEFNFGITKIRYFRVFLESTHIQNTKQPIRIHFE